MVFKYLAGPFLRKRVFKLVTLIFWNIPNEMNKEMLIGSSWPFQRSYLDMSGHFFGVELNFQQFFFQSMVKKCIFEELEPIFGSDRSQRRGNVLMALKEFL